MANPPFARVVSKGFDIKADSSKDLCSSKTVADYPQWRRGSHPALEMMLHFCGNPAQAANTALQQLDETMKKLVQRGDSRRREGGSVYQFELY